MAKKQRTRLEDDSTFQGDRISTLPDDILVLILSSLSLREAIKTSILCSRWRYLWIITPILDLDLDSTAILLLYRQRNYSIDKLRREYVRWVDRLFTILPESSTTNLVRFRVAFDLPSVFSGWIDDWVSSAVSRKVESLDLMLSTYNYSYSPQECYHFPYHEGYFPENLKVLKKLSLHCVNVSSEAVAFLLGNCSLLEQLSLSRCGYMLSHLEVVGTSPAFKCLEISLCIGLHSVLVRESNVVCIKYAGPAIKQYRFKLEGVPHLTQLWVHGQPHMMKRRYITNIRGIVDTFDSVLSQLHTLKIYSNYKINRDDTLQRTMPFLKELVVVVLGSDYSDNCSLMPIISWFSVAPYLERFVIEASHQDRIDEKKKELELLEAPEMINLLYGDDYDVSEINRKKEVQRAYSHIKEVGFVGYRGVRSHFQMITQLVRNGVALEKITVDPRPIEHRRNMPWDRISRNQMEDEIIARKRAKDQLRQLCVTPRINVNIL